MRYVLIGFMLILLFSAAMLIRMQARISPRVGVGLGTQPTAMLGRPNPVPNPTILTIPTVHAPEVPVSGAVVTKDQAISLARADARNMGEANPMLIDAILTTQGDARERLRGPDGTAADGPEPRASGISDNGAVWLVRMSGSFRPDDYPGGWGPTPTPKPGIMVVIVNAADGHEIAHGILPEGFPLR